MTVSAAKASARERWHPSALVTASLAAHAAAAGVLVLRPSVWPWVIGGLVADHALLTAAGFVPRGSLLGPNWARLQPPATARGEVAVTFDDGPDPEVTPRVLDLLDQHRVRATFFCIGARVAANPELARDIVARGHAIENHSLRHLRRFSLLGPCAMTREINAAQDLIASVVGVAPRFFRAPAGLRNPFLDPVLARIGLRLASWTRRGFDTVNPHPDAVLRRLLRGLGSGDILMLHDGHSARMPNGQPVVLEVLPALLGAIAAERLTPVTLRSTL